MSLKILPEIFQRALERLDGAGRKGAKGMAGTQQSALLFQDRDVPRLALSAFHGVKHALDPRQPLAARRTPAAGLMREELYQVMHHPHGTRSVIEDDHGACAEPPP